MDLGGTMKKLIFIFLFSCLLLAYFPFSFNFVHAEAHDFTQYKMLLGQTNGFMPSKGKANILIIPVDFIDEKHQEKTESVEQIESLFFNRVGEPFNNVADYYLKSSQEQLAIKGKVMPYFQSSWKKSQLKSFDDSLALLMLALKSYTNLNLSSFDCNADSYIDGVYLLHSGEGLKSGTMSWPYTVTSYSPISIQNMKVNHFVSIGLASMHVNQIEGNPKSFIHETGHLLGLQDYYSNTNSPQKGGVGGSDMMDTSNGDHNAFSKLILGWVQPIYLDEKNSKAEIKKGFVGIIHSQRKEEWFFIEPYANEELNFHNSLKGTGYRIFHADLSRNQEQTHFLFNNQSTSHKLLKMIQADGDESIEKNGSLASSKDLLKNGEFIKLMNYPKIDSGYIIQNDLGFLKVSKQEGTLKMFEQMEDEMNLFNSFFNEENGLLNNEFASLFH